MSGDRAAAMPFPPALALLTRRVRDRSRRLGADPERVRSILAGDDGLIALLGHLITKEERQPAEVSVTVLAPRFSHRMAMEFISHGVRLEWSTYALDGVSDQEMTAILRQFTMLLNSVLRRGWAAYLRPHPAISLRS